MTEKIFWDSSWKLKTGIAFITVFSIITGILNFGILYLFGIPLFGILLGIIFIWLAETSAKIKIVWTILPIPIILATFFLFFQLSKAEPETFLIQQNYRGEIVVFYNEPCGQQPIYETDRRIYNIPHNGVLVTNFKKNRGHLDRKFYLFDRDGNRIEIPQFQWQNFDSEKRNWNSLHSNLVTEFTKDSVGAFWAYGTETYGLSRNSLSYIISTYGYFEKDQKELWHERKKFTEIAENLLNECRRTRQQ